MSGSGARQGQSPTETYWSLGLIPVQEWIAEARRSRDLLAGSRLLSWFMARVLWRIREADGQIVVPRVDDARLRTIAGRALGDYLDAAAYALPNRSTGSFPGTPKLLAEQLRSLASSLVPDLWRTLVGEAARASEMPAPLRAQLGRAGDSCPVHLVWCCEALDPATALCQIDALYLAVKRTRLVEPWVGAPVGKCVQCGHREALGPNDWGAWRSYWREIDALEDVQRGSRFEPGETLCGVCVTKRIVGYTGAQAFPSTSEIALAAWLRDVKAEPALIREFEAVERHVRVVAGASSDEAPLYYQRTVKRRQAQAVGSDAFQELAGALRGLEDAIKARRREMPSTPPEYLAVVMFDGDSIGKRVQKDVERVPACLAAVAERLVGLFDSPASLPTLGRPFYLGGDEGLVLAPLDAVFPLATHVRQAWKATMAGLAPPPTFSMGVAVFDRERPLGEAIRTAREMVEAAKELPRKNGLAMAVQTASGSMWHAVDAWTAGSWDWAATALGLIREDRLSMSWAYDVEGFLRTLTPGAWEVPLRRSAIRAEVQRLTQRRVVVKPGGDRAQLAHEVWMRLKGPTWWVEPPERPETVANQFHLIAFLAKEAVSIATSGVNDPGDTA